MLHGHTGSTADRFLEKITGGAGKGSEPSATGVDTDLSRRTDRPGWICRHHPICFVLSSVCGPSFLLIGSHPVTADLPPSGRLISLSSGNRLCIRERSGRGPPWQETKTSMEGAPVIVYRKEGNPEVGGKPGAGFNKQILLRAGSR